MPDQLWRVWASSRKEDFLLCRSQMWDWGVYPERDEQMPDHKIAAWAVKELKKKQDKPQFPRCWILPAACAAVWPQKWFDLYPLESLQLPKVLEKIWMTCRNMESTLPGLIMWHQPMTGCQESNEWKPLVQSYLACVSFVDHQVGKVLDALDNSPAKDNTLIILYSDHGFHLGEKERWAKRSLWEDSTRVPSLSPAPGWPKARSAPSPCNCWMSTPPCLELAGLNEDEKLEGNSMATLLKNPDAQWPHMARTSFGPGNYSIRSERYRYIHYNDGSEEFYDHADDAHEWNNQIGNPELAALIEEHRAHKPKQFHPVLGTDSTGHKAYKASEAAKKQTSSFDPLDWKRPVDNPVFTTTFGNNHDSVLFVDPELEYPYHLIISHTEEAAHLWRAKKFSWSSADWELVSDQYIIGKHYEYDDGVKVDGTYYLYEEGIVYTFTGPLEEASGKWKAAGTFPFKQCDDIGIYYEDGVFHMFGEHGDFPHGPDGTSLATSAPPPDWATGNWSTPRRLIPTPMAGTSTASEMPPSKRSEESITSTATANPRAAPTRSWPGNPRTLISPSSTWAKRSPRAQTKWMTGTTTASRTRTSPTSRSWADTSLLLT